MWEKSNLANTDSKENRNWQIFKEWSQNISVQGIPNIVREKNPIVRGMWLVLFLASNALCILTIAVSVIIYLKYDVVTTIRVVEKDFLPFPAVTVCNTNPFVTEAAFEQVQSLLKANNLTNFTKPTLFDQILSENYTSLFLNYNMLRLFGATYLKSLFNDQKKSFAIPFSNIVTQLSMPCDQNDWIGYFDSFFGYCYRFNSEKSRIKRSFHTGKYNGLMLEIHVGIPDSRQLLTLSTGAHIFINDNPIRPLVAQGLDLASGSYTNIVIKRTTNKQMARPYSECVNNLGSIDSFDSEYYRKVLRSNLTYRQVDCFCAYIQSEVYKKCKCDDIASNIVSENGNTCDTVEELLCSAQTYQEITASEYKSRIKNECPLECDTVRYDTMKSESRYPSASYAKELAKTDRVKLLFDNRSNVSLEEFRESILAVNIYYESLKQTEITESASVTLDALIADIGGIHGLFLGISILSFAEIIDLIIMIRSIDPAYVFSSKETMELIG
ncbi:acid-sensing ion channel 5 [Brachionus plicatilis]|uniref:Acid-sensing ion channel 5 n=1 Tax=Brachionus plicatilis TaxID=10195 RepID=A0A3M7P7T0_BRAPC|nr:acid-sensing ion channel 5 [Brachionus plicatilis]